MTDKVHKIKDWVKNLKSQASTIPNLGINALAGFQLACDDVIAFLNSLPEEPVSEDLKEEIERWIKQKHFIFTEIDEIIETAHHFAE